MTFDKLSDILTDLSNNPNKIDEYFTKAKEYEFDSHANMLSFLLVLYKYKCSTINLNTFDITTKSDFKYYEFLRRIDDTVMCTYCVENKNVKNDAVYYFYLDYIHLNYILKNYAEVMRCCRNLELIFGEDDKILFYKLLYLFENFELLTPNQNANKKIFIDEFDRYLYKTEKTPFDVKAMFYSHKISELTLFYNELKKESVNINIESENDADLTKKELLMNAIINYKPTQESCEEITQVCTDKNIENLLNSLIEDYIYLRERFKNIKSSKFQQREIISIQKELFSFYDKTAYILYKLYNITNIEEDKVYFNTKFFIEAKLSNSTKLISLPNPFIKTLYLYLNIYALRSKDLSKKSIFSIGTWDIATERNVAEHRSTILVQEKKESSLLIPFYQVRNCIFTLIQLIKFEIPTTEIR